MSNPSTGDRWVLKAVLEGLTFALLAGLLAAALGPILADRLAEATREPTCSDPRELSRALPVNSRASSALPDETTKDGRELHYGAPSASDGDTGTAWVEGASGLGQGEWIEFEFSPGVEITLICIVNGYALTWDLYQQNSRIRGLQVSNDTNLKTVAALGDVASSEHTAVFQDVPLDQFPSSQTLRLTITSVYAASGRQRFDDTSLSEIEFWSSA